MENVEEIIKRERNRIHLSQSEHGDLRRDEGSIVICFGIYYLDKEVIRKASRGGYGGGNYRTWKMSDRIYALGENKEAKQWAIFDDNDNRKHLAYFDEEEENGLDTTKLSLEALCGIFKEIFAGTRSQVEDKLYREMLEKAIGYLHRPSVVIGIQNPILVDNWKNVIIKAKKGEEGE